MLLFYVRHGDPIYNPDSLTELGHAQAEALAARMKICAPERIFSSSSNRAILTATPTAKALGKEIEILDWCNERYAFQELRTYSSEGRPQWLFQNAKMVEFLASAEVRRLDDKWYTHPRFVDTTYKAGMERIAGEADAFMLSLGYRHDHERNGYVAQAPNTQRVALFAHQGFGLAFLSCLLDIPYPQMCTRFDLGHSSVTAIEFADSGFTVPRVLQMSNDSHLFAGGVETSYQNRILF